MPDSITIRPMPVGAEVIGSLAGREEDPDVRALLNQAWFDHGLLVFHDVASIEEHLALSRCFGELEIHPFAPVRSKLHPLLIELGGPNRYRAYMFDGTDLRCNRIAWHRDTAYTPDICKGAMLRMLEVPAEHGETMVCDTARAWDDLSPAMKAKLERLEWAGRLRLGPDEQTRPGAFWKSVRPATEAEDPDGRPEASNDHLKALYPPVFHPAVLTHPDSGRKCIFLSPTYVDHFVGLSQAESDDLLDTLVGHMLQPDYVHVHRWRVNDALLWDNRRCMHASPGNIPGQPRFGLRTTLAGPTRTGRYQDEGAATQLPQHAD